MASFNSVTFNPHALDGVYWPYWQEELIYSLRHIPGNNIDDLQFAGRSRYELTVTADVGSDADLSTLRGSMDNTARTLTDYNGNNYTNCYLVGMESIKRWDAGETWVVTLKFIRTTAP